MIYSVTDWDTRYENNRSRLVKELGWVPVPNNHDGEAFARLMQRKDAAIVFSSWILILQVASRCDPRGLLVKANGTPHDAESLSLRTRAPIEWFAKSFPILTEYGWISRKDNQGNDVAPGRQLGALDPSTKEGRKEGIEGKKEGRAVGTAPASSADWLISLRSNRAYDGIDIDREHGKCLAWCAANKRTPSAKRFVNWLNKCDRPMGLQQSTPRAPAPAPLKEPIGWRQWFNQHHPDTPYSKGGALEVETWAGMPRAWQEKIEAEIGLQPLQLA